MLETSQKESFSPREHIIPCSPIVILFIPLPAGIEFGGTQLHQALVQLAGRPVESVSVVSCDRKHEGEKLKITLDKSYLQGRRS